MKSDLSAFYCCPGTLHSFCLRNGKIPSPFHPSPAAAADGIADGDADAVVDADMVVVAVVVAVVVVVVDGNERAQSLTKTTGRCAHTRTS